MISAIGSIYGLLMRVSLPLLLVLALLTVSAVPPTWKWATAARKLHAAERKIEALNDDVANTRAGLALCQLNSDRLTAALDAQNAAVQELKADSDARTARANTAIARAQAQTRTLREKVMRLERAKPSGDQCMAARSLIVETLGADR